MKRLHIGCGKVYLPGWTNVDLFSNTKADLYCDMMRLPYDKETFVEIYASHVLEHAQRHTVRAVLHHWRELLIPGGTLKLAVPDFYKICKRYEERGLMDEIMGLLYGGQNHPLNSHCVAFDYLSLRQHLIDVGFNAQLIGMWDWKTTTHAKYDDYSQSYLPHMEKETGLLMSLNVLAIK